jgi:predicted Fe-S protein YdhL (DUF1289 family)
MTDSPCTNVCAIDDEDTCVGCGRTLTEIASWASMTDDEREAVLGRLSDSNAEKRSEEER